MVSTQATAVITGAAGGIGLGIARASVAEGMAVAVCDLDGSAADKAASALRDAGATAVGLTCDVTDRAQVDAVRDHVYREFGRVDYLFNNAGIGLARPFLETRSQDWDLVLGVNVHGVLNGLYSFLPDMLEADAGHVSTTSSLSGFTGDADLAAYSASKCAVTAIMQSLHYELERDGSGVTCSLLCPGPVATDLLANSDRSLERAGSDPFTADFAELDANLASGVNPDLVGAVTIEGIREGRFWLLPQPELASQLLDGQAASIRTGKVAESFEW